MGDYGRGYRDALDTAARFADEYEAENFRMCNDGIMLDPVLAAGRGPHSRTLTAADYRKSERFQIHSTVHSSMGHAARNIAAAIRAMPVPEEPA